tara:strand:- start:2338 stop:2973 length:636 start_codon:yes stop_codon:yes gene_type:complete
MDNAIFKYNKNIIKLGKVTLTGSQVNQYWESDDPQYVDWTTLKLRKGDSICYNKPNKNDKGFKVGGFTVSEIGVISAATIAARATVATTIADSVLEDFQVNKDIPVYVNRNLLNTSSGNYYYSYPIKNYVGIVSYDDSTLSLFFERTDRMIDEVRVNISKNSHSAAIIAINKVFKFSNGKDIVFDEDDSLTKSNVVHGVNKVISTVPINRN